MFIVVARHLYNKFIYVLSILVPSSPYCAKMQKPQNCAFDVRGDIKLFDFGLSKELYDNHMTANGTYEPSSIVGALRYMPPEVFKGEPYNFSVDTYAFSILLWEILALEKPYPELNFDLAGLEREVIHGGLRPPLQDDWPESMWEMMCAGWSEDLFRRPNMPAIVGTLRRELMKTTEG